jgi:hypothetical protein
MLLEPFQATTTTHKRGKSSSPLDTSLVTPHPITVLPVEILSEIMCYMPLFYGHDAPSIHPLDPDLDPSRRFTKDSPIRTPHWVAVSHVCRHWRQVALKCRGLWTCIPLVSPNWAQRALTLSHPHPITLRIDSEDNSLDRGYVSADALCLALAHMSRIYKIHIHSPWGTKYGDRILSILYGILCRGAPVLEELDLASDVPFIVYSGPEWSAMTSAMAKLRVLRLGECVLPADCFLFHSGLTQLRLSGTRVMWPTLESFISTLSLLSNLQVLELYGVLPSAHALSLSLSSVSSDLLSMDLPLLKELHLGGTGQSILAALQSLNLSENVQVFVTLPNSSEENGSLSQWLTKLRGRQGIVSAQTHTVH